MEQDLFRREKAVLVTSERLSLVPGIGLKGCFAQGDLIVHIIHVWHRGRF